MLLRTNNKPLQTLEESNCEDSTIEIDKLHAVHLSSYDELLLDDNTIVHCNSSSSNRSTAGNGRFRDCKSCLQSSFLLNDPSNAIGICNLDYKNGLLGASASGDATGLPLLPTYKPQAGKKTFLSTIPLDIDCKGHLQA
jgi:hypothetical protein